MRPISELVREFHLTFGAPVAVGVTDNNINKLRYDLIKEELYELGDALVDEDLVAVADALGDLAYVVYGAALTYGIDLDAVVREIHRSNMTKLMPDGSVAYREDGKILKGPWFEEPDLAPIVAPQSLDANRESA